MNDNNKIGEEDLKMNKKTPFSVPENYFEELPLRIQERIHKNKSGKKVVGWIRPIPAYAALIAVLIVIGFLGIRQMSTNTPAHGLSTEEVERAIEQFAFEMNDETLVSMVNDSDLDFLQEETETDLYIEYLSDEYIDFREITNETSKRK